MRRDRLFIVFAVFLLLFIFMGNVTAINDFESNSISIQDNSTVNIVSTGLEENEELLSNSDEIIANDWDDLKYYCSLSDKNYNIKLKEDTNYYPDNTNSDDYQIVINNNVTIVGSSGAYIGDSSSNPRTITYIPIKVNDKSGIGITLENITFKWIGTSYGESGVFLTLAGDVNNTIKNCYFMDITTSVGHSSIIHIKYGDLLMENCSFVNCTTDYGCISVYCPDDRNSDVYTSARMHLTDSYFEGNYAKVSCGCINNCGFLIINNTTFHRNSAGWWAGAVHTHSSANTTVYNSTFSNNVAGWNGGALYTYSYLQIYNSTFLGNNCTTNNGGGAIGAWTYGHAPFLHVEGSLFENNENLCWGLTELSTSGTGRGGAISFSGAGLMEILRSTFIHNSASIGSAISVTTSEYGSPLVRLIENSFINHTRSGDPLVIKINANSNHEIRDNYYLNNSFDFAKLKLSADNPVNGTVTFHIDTQLNNPLSFDSDILEKSGYDIYLDGVYKTTLYGKTFTLDFKTIGNAYVYVVPSISNSRSNDVLAGVEKTYIYLSQIFGDDANDGLSRDTPLKTLNKSIELAKTHGNIIIMDGTFNENNLVVDYDLTIVGEQNIFISSVRGNVFVISDGEVVFNNITFIDCKLSSDGAARERIIQFDDGFLTLINCTFENNEYRALISSSQGSVEGENIRFYNNYAALMQVPSVSISDSLFIGNSANKTNYLSLILSSSKLEVSNLLFNRNNIKKSCIEISSGTASVKSSNFTNNVVSGSNSASCIYINGGSATVRSSIIMNNRAAESTSSIIYVYGGSLSIQDSIILNNSHSSTSIIVGKNSNVLRAVVCNNNWWGNTIDDLSAPQLDSSIRCINRFILNLSSSKQLLVYMDNEEATITFDLNYMIDKNGNISYNVGNLPQITLNLSIVNGQDNYNNITLINSKNAIPFHLNTFNNGYVTAKFNNLQSTLELYPVKKDPNFNINVINVSAGESADIIVSTDLNVSSYELLIDGQAYLVNLTEGVGTISIENIAKGLHEISLTYPESDIYRSVELYKQFEVYGFDADLSIQLNNSYYGNDVLLIVNAPEDATGNVTVTIGNLTLNKTINNKTQFIFLNLSAGIYEVFINYSGDNKYYSDCITSNLTIFKYNSTISLSISEIIIGQDVFLTADVLPDAKGNVTFTINGNSEIINITDSKAVYAIRNISKGDYNIKVTYNGDEWFLTSENYTRFSVLMLNSTVNVNVENITYGENATINISVSEGATGNVTIFIDEYNETVRLTEGIARIIVPYLTSGIKMVTVLYHGDENYLSSTNSATLNISKANPQFSVTANSAMVGNEIKIHIDFNRLMRGNFTITVGEIGVDKNITNRGLLNDWTIPTLNPNDYIVNVRYNGDDNFKTGNNSTTFTIYEYPKVQVANEGIDSKNTDNSPYEAISNGLTSFIIDITGNISTNIVIDNEGNIYFATDNVLYAYSNDGHLIWNYSTFNMGDNKFSGIALGRGTLIATMSGDKLYLINITNGGYISGMTIGSSDYSPILDENYTIYISSEKQYSSSDYYLVMISYGNWKGSTAKTVSTGKLMPVSAPILINDRRVGILTEYGLTIMDTETDRVVSNLNYVSHTYRPVVGAGGFIYSFGEDSVIAIDPEGSKLWETPISGGMGKYMALDSQIGYLYSVNSNGVLYRYDSTDGEESLVYDFKENITSNILIDSQGNLYLGSEEGMFYSLDSEGNMLWKVHLNGKITGTPVLDEEGSIYTTVNSSSIVKLANAPLIDSTLSANIKNITVGDDLSVEIEFDREMTGQIIFKINNAIYNSSSIKNENHLKLIVANLNVGNYTSQIIYSGDKRFKEGAVEIKFSVLKHETILNVSSPNEINVSQNAVIEITCPNGLTGNIIMCYNNINQSLPINDAKISVAIGNLKEGDVIVTFKFEGNEKFTYWEKSVSIHVSKIMPNTDTAVDISDSISIDLANGTGNLTVIVDGNVYKTVKLVNGKANVDISGLASGNHHVTVIYSGDNRYASFSKETSLHVPLIKLTGSDFTMFYTSGAKYKVHLTSDGVGMSDQTVVFTVNGKIFKAVTDKNGYASVTINLPPKSAKYTLTATFNGIKATNNVKVNGIVTAKNVKVKKSAKSLKIKVTLKKVNGKYLKSKKVTLKFKGKTYKANTNKNGVATFKIPKKVIKKLKAGKKYTYKATYLKQSVSKKVTVKK